MPPGTTLGQAVNSVSHTLSSPEESGTLSDKYLHGISDLVGNMFTGTGAEKDAVPKSLSSTLVSDKVFSEYAVVDKSEIKEGLLVKQRGGDEQEELVDAKASSSSRFRIW